MKHDTRIEIWPLSRVLPYEGNAKIHDNKQVAKIAASIKRFGWRGNPIVVNKQGVILAGHGRRLAAIELGRTDVPVEVVDLTAEEERAFRLADNRVAISNLDTAVLQKELAELVNFDMADIFDKKELVFLEADLGEMNESAFVDDLDMEIEKQAAETIETVKQADEKDVSIGKALGFKTIKGRDERAVAMFMADIEQETGKEGAEAFIAFVSSRAAA